MEEDKQEHHKMIEDSDKEKIDRQDINSMPVAVNKPKRHAGNKTTTHKGLAYRTVIGCVVLLIAFAALIAFALQGKFNENYFRFPEIREVSADVKYMNGYAYLDKLGVMRAIEQSPMSDDALKEKYGEQFEDNITVIDGVDFIDLTRVFSVTNQIFYIKTEEGQDKVYMQAYVGDSFDAAEMDEFISQCNRSGLNLAEAIYYLGVVKNISISSGAYLDSIVILGDNIKNNSGLTNYAELHAALVNLHAVSTQMLEQQENDLYTSTYNIYIDAVNDFNRQCIEALRQSKNLPQEIKALFYSNGGAGGERLSYEESLKYLWDNRERSDVKYTEINPAPELVTLVRCLDVISRTNNIRVDSEHMPSILEIKEFEIAMNLFNVCLEEDTLVQTYWDRFDAIEQGLIVDMPDRPSISSNIEYMGSDAKIEFPDVVHLEGVECLKVTSTDMSGDTVQNKNSGYHISLSDMNNYFQTEFTREDVERDIHEENEKVYVSLDSACGLWGKIFFIGNDNLLYMQESAGGYTAERLEALIETFYGQPLPLALFYIGMDGDLPAEDTREFLDFVSRLGSYTYTKEYSELLNGMLDYSMCNVYADTYNYNLEGKDYQSEQHDNLKRYYHAFYEGLLSDKVLPYLPHYAQDLLTCENIEIDDTLSDVEVVKSIRDKLYEGDFEGLLNMKATSSTKTLLQSVQYTYLGRERVEQYPTIMFPKNEESSKAILALILFYNTFTTVDGFEDIW